jgi:hypothetical protein
VKLFDLIGSDFFTELISGFDFRDFLVDFDECFFVLFDWS